MRVQRIVKVVMLLRLFGFLPAFRVSQDYREINRFLDVERSLSLVGRAMYLPGPAGDQAAKEAEKFGV
jgi:hypothetical protein